jgi:hypothetical protein
MKIPVFHPKYIPSFRTRWWVKTEPEPKPFNPLYNGRPQFYADNNSRNLKWILSVVMALLAMNLIKTDREIKFSPKPPPEEYSKFKPKSGKWVDDTIADNLTIIPYEVYKELPVAPQLDSSGKPFIAPPEPPAPTPPPMPYYATDYRPTGYVYGESDTFQTVTAKSLVPKSYGNTPSYSKGVLWTQESFRTVKKPFSTTQTSHVVFAGSFDDRENAELTLKKLKNLGFTHAEIVMKEQLPYLIVIAGFYADDAQARAALKKLKQAGIKTYWTATNWEEIFRNYERREMRDER